MILVEAKVYDLGILKNILVTKFKEEGSEEILAKWKAYVFMMETAPRIGRDAIGLLFLGYPILTSYDIMGTPTMLETISKERSLPNKDFFFREGTPYKLNTYYIGKKDTLRELGLPSFEVDTPPTLRLLSVINDIEPPPEKVHSLYHYSISEDLERKMQEDGYYYADIAKEIKKEAQIDIATFKK